jgi:hypothetical protein
MAAYELGERIWVIERRRAVIWTREGKPGARGRIRSEEFGSEDEAVARVEAVVAEKLAEGFALADEARSIDAPLYKRGRKPRAERHVSELCARLRTEVEPAETLAAVLEGFARVTTSPCSSKLIRLSFETSEDGGHVTLEAVFGDGRGDNPDDYDQDGYRAAVALAALERDDLGDGVDLDVFADELRRVPQAALVARFRAAVHDLASFAALADARPRTVTVERIG